MSVGIISYLSNRGLGTMAHDLRKQLGITRQLVIPDGDWPYQTHWMNGEEFYLRQWHVQKDDLVAWKQTDNIDTIVCIETPFGDDTFKWAKELKMRTVLIVMWEHFHPKSPAYQNVDLYLCPSFRCFQEVPFDSKRFLPYPVDTDEFKFSQRSGPARTFLHCAGSGGLNGRKGTRQAIEGFVKAAKYLPGIQLVVRSQVPIDQIIPDVGELGGSLPVGQILFEGPTLDRTHLYSHGDVLIYCSKYDGHSLVGLEGMASGMPVITTDADPMNEITRDRTLLVRVATHTKAGTVNPHCMANTVDTDDLAAKITWCATNDMSEISTANRQIVEKEHSWTALRPRWEKALGLESQ